MPSLVKLYQEFQDSEFIILAIDIQESKQKVKKYVQANGVPFPVLLDRDGQTARAYSVRGTPAHFLIDKKGGPRISVYLSAPSPCVCIRTITFPLSRRLFLLAFA